MRTRRAYKLFQTKKRHPGKLFPLFIDSTHPVPIGVWVSARAIQTTGYALRPGWHVGVLPIAPHLLRKDGTLPANRVWAEVEIPAEVDWQPVADASPHKDLGDRLPVNGHYRFPRPPQQGGAWLIAGALKVLRVLTASEVAALAAREVDT